MKGQRLTLPGFSVLSHFFTICLIACCSLASMGQATMPATITLKSGMVIKGDVVKIEQNEYIEIKTPLGSTMKINWIDIQTLDFSSTPAVIPLVPSKSRFRSYYYNDTGFYFSMSGGFPFGTDIDGYPTLGLSGSIVVGKSFGQKVNLGLLLGSDFYWWPNTGTIPLGIEYRGRIINSGFSPYYYTQAGYGFIGYSEYENSSWRRPSQGETKGGLFIAPGFGIMNKRRAHSSWFLQFGYKIQKTYSSYWDTIWDLGEQREVLVNEDITFKRMDIKFGFIFD